ncbi:MAG: methyltransferase domain-containing protein [Candidatus Krumholzibacteriota bacterium]
MAENYDSTYEEDEAVFGEKESHLLEKCAEIIPEGARVLDLGVGQGRNAFPLARLGYQVTGIDTSQVSVDTVNRLAKEEKLPVEAILQDFMNFEPDRSFDVVLCFGLMQMLDLQGCASLIERLHHWTRPGGVLFLTAWHIDDPSFDTCCKDWERRSGRTFRSADGEMNRLFLESGEILKLFFRWEVVHHWEGLGKPHKHGAGKEERHGEVEAVLIRPKK